MKLSTARRAALRKLHASRRGKHINDTGRARETVLAQVFTLVREPVYGVRSIRVVASFCGVNERSVRRWLSGQHWPHPTHLQRIQQWLRASKHRK